LTAGGMGAADTRTANNHPLTGERTMLTAITYNCNPESLGDVAPETFVDAFEAAVVARPKYRDLFVTVTFEPAASGLTSIASDDTDADISHDAEIRDEFGRLAERAFEAAINA
jgi:hypothetical protein